MTERTDDAELFDEDILAVVAERYEVNRAELATVAMDHQESVASLPGIENLAYEWRKHYGDPLVERTQRAYYMRVPSRVWDEFAESLSLDEEPLAALVDLHRELLASTTDVDGELPPDQTYVVLDRTVDGE